MGSRSLPTPSSEAPVRRCAAQPARPPLGMPRRTWCCVLGGIRSASGAAGAALQDGRGGSSRRARRAPARRASGRGRSSRRTMLLLPYLLSPSASPPPLDFVCQAVAKSIKRRAALQRRVPHLPHFFHSGVTKKAAPSVNRAAEAARLASVTNTDSSRPPTAPQSCDLVVVGGGIIGLACCDRLGPITTAEPSEQPAS